MENKLELLKNLPYWEHLSVAEKDLVEASASFVHFEKGAILSSRSSACLGMVYMIGGNVRVYILSEEGREITLFKLEEADTCVLSSSCVIDEITFETQMIAEEDCDILVVPAHIFAKLADSNIYVRCYLYETTTSRFSEVMWVMQQILFLRFDQRLAHFLLDEYEKSGSKEIRLSQDQIAQEINSAREVVARMLKQFVNDGLIEMKRKCISIKDVQGLENLL